MYLSNETNMQVIYEDNHLIAVSKTCHEIVQGDKTGDPSLADELREWIREKYAKPGNVFVGVVHRLDRPVTGAVVFAKTSKGLARMNALFRDGGVRKTYWAILRQRRSQRACSSTGFGATSDRTKATSASPTGQAHVAPSFIIVCWPPQTAITCWRSTSVRVAIIRSVASWHTWVARSRAT